MSSSIAENQNPNYFQLLQLLQLYDYTLRKVTRKNKLIKNCILGGCVTSDKENPTVDEICRSLKEDQQLVTLFSENFIPVNCRSSLEGVWQFAYQVSRFLYFVLKEVELDFLLNDVAKGSENSRSVDKQFGIVVLTLKQIKNRREDLEQGIYWELREDS